MRSQEGSAYATLVWRLAINLNRFRCPETTEGKLAELSHSRQQLLDHSGFSLSVQESALRDATKIVAAFPTAREFTWADAYRRGCLHLVATGYDGTAAEVVTRINTGLDKEYAAWILEMCRTLGSSGEVLTCRGMIEYFMKAPVPVSKPIDSGTLEWFKMNRFNMAPGKLAEFTTAVEGDIRESTQILKLAKGDTYTNDLLRSLCTAVEYDYEHLEKALTAAYSNHLCGDDKARTREAIKQVKREAIASGCSRNRLSDMCCRLGYHLKSVSRKLRQQLQTNWSTWTRSGGFCGKTQVLACRELAVKSGLSQSDVDRLTEKLAPRGLSSSDLIAMLYYK